jgi:hypothetical protein
LLARFKELGTRIAGLTFAPRRNPAVSWPVALGLELGYRVTVNRTPLRTGNQIAVDQIVEHITHHFTPRAWTTEIATSPVDPTVGDYLILDDALYGLLDTGLLAY